MVPKRFCRVVPVVTINGTTRMLPPNPGRVAVLLPSVGGTSYGFGWAQDQVITSSFFIDTGQSQCLIDYETYGETIKGPWFITAGAAFNTAVIEVTCECAQDKLNDRMDTHTPYME